MISLGEDTNEQAVIQTLEDAGFEVEYRENQDRYHVKSHESEAIKVTCDKAALTRENDVGYLEGDYAVIDGYVHMIQEVED